MDEFIDYDFTKDKLFIPGSLGLGDEGKFCGAYEDANEVYDYSRIDEGIEKLDVLGGGMDQLVTRIYNQGQEGSCFPAGTLVTMATGEQRPIEKISVLEHVLTAEGNIGQVRQLHAREYAGYLIGIGLFGHNLVRCTPEHPILTKRGYVPAGELNSSDYVALTKAILPEVRVIQTDQHIPVRCRASNELRTRNFGAPIGRTRTSVQISAVPDVLELDAPLGKIIGFLLAEGNIDVQKVCWTFNINELDTHVAELTGLLRERLGLGVKIRTNSGRNTAKVEVFGARWARLFESLCSTGSGSKRLCPELMAGPDEFVRAVFDGWFAGDGYRGNRRNVGVTISRQLAVQMFQIASRLGMKPSLRRSEPTQNRHAKTRQPRYDLEFTSDPQETYRAQDEEKHLWRKVRMLTKEDFSGHVFNIHVAGDESYVADGMGVHNCVANAFSQSNEIAQALQHGKDKVTHLSAISLYKRIGRSPGSGAMVSDGIAEMRSRGILPLNNDENKAKYKHTMPNTGFYTPFPQGWEETAALFKGDEYYIVRTPQALFTALLKGCPVVVGRSGHSICYVRPMKKNGQRVVKYANSWGNWGDNGYGYDSSRMIAQSAQWAVAVVSTVNQRRVA